MIRFLCAIVLAVFAFASTADAAPRVHAARLDVRTARINARANRQIARINARAAVRINARTSFHRNFTRTSFHRNFTRAFFFNHGYTYSQQPVPVQAQLTYSAPAQLTYSVPVPVPAQLIYSAPAQLLLLSAPTAHCQTFRFFGGFRHH